jgi:hypothetical protein
MHGAWINSWLRMQQETLMISIRVDSAVRCALHVTFFITPLASFCFTAPQSLAFIVLFNVCNEVAVQYMMPVASAMGIEIPSDVTASMACG